MKENKQKINKKPIVDSLNMEMENRAIVGLQLFVLGCYLTEMYSIFLVKNNLVGNRVTGAMLNSQSYCATVRKRIMDNFPELEDPLLVSVDILVELIEGVSVFKTQEEREHYLEYLKRYEAPISK